MLTIHTLLLPPRFTCHAREDRSDQTYYFDHSFLCQPAECLRLAVSCDFVVLAPLYNRELNNLTHVPCDPSNETHIFILAKGSVYNHVLCFIIEHCCRNEPCMYLTPNAYSLENKIRRETDCSESCTKEPAYAHLIFPFSFCEPLQSNYR
jgi:hypothetical protein